MAELDIVDFVKTAERLLISQYQKPNFKALFRIMSQVFTDIQENTFKLRDKFWLLDATGEQLEYIGRLWDEGRNGQGDTDYRARIFNKIAQSSSGTIQEIKNFLYSAYGATYVNYRPEYPAGFRMSTDAEITVEELYEFSSAGVGSYAAANIIDALGGNLIDAVGNEITHTVDV